VGLHVEALYQHQRHILNCKDFKEYAYRSLSQEPFTQPPMPGILHLTNVSGGGSFIYWEWVSNLYKIFGEIVETASLKRPEFTVPIPTLGSVVNPAWTLQIGSNVGHSWVSNSKNQSIFNQHSSVNHMLTLQHSGFYYLIAARAAEERWKRAAHANTSTPGSIISGMSVEKSFIESLNRESTLNHSSVVIELLTKSYENFKLAHCMRTSLFLISEIARIYQETGEYELALTLYEKIAKAYRKEGWLEILAVVCHRMKLCATQTGDTFKTIQSSFELLGLFSKSAYPMIDPVKTTLVSQLNSITSHTQVNLDNAVKFFKTDFTFAHADGQVGQKLSFFLDICFDIDMVSLGLPVNAITIEFSNPLLNFTILNDNSEVNSTLIDCNKPQLTDNGHLFPTGLALSPSTKYTFKGFIDPKESQDVELVKVGIDLLTVKHAIKLSTLMVENEPESSPILVQVSRKPDRIRKMRFYTIYLELNNGNQKLILRYKFRIHLLMNLWN
jgi:tetratricopeptide (TPR) repeat protein